MNSVVDSLLASAGLFPRAATKSRLRTRVLQIGPREAEALLVANKDNRRLRPGRVAYYAKVMRQGEWRLTHQGIAFCEDGRGLDLQHRLHAIILAGVTVEMMVTEGLSAEAFNAIDQHERRSVADALRLGRSLVDAARFLLLAKGGDGASNPTNLEVGEVSAAIESFHDRVLQACNTRKAVLSSAPMRCAAVLALWERPELSDFVLKTYRNLMLMTTTEWTPAMQAFFKQVTAGKVKTSTAPDRLDLLSRGLVLFDWTKTGVSKVVADPDTVAAARVRVKRMLDSTIGVVPEAHLRNASETAPHPRRKASVPLQANSLAP